MPCKHEGAIPWQVLPVVPGQAQLHGLGSNDWMYWGMDVLQDGSTVLVQLNRTAGDPVLFLKPVQAGFQVTQAPHLSQAPGIALTAAISKQPAWPSAYAGSARYRSPHRTLLSATTA